ncbi:hypothetical protein ACROYT_G016544 [Oculina patagonica]
MSSYPTALFDALLLPRQANKPALAHAIWTMVQGSQTESPSTAHYVLDGGALIHRVIWPPGLMYDAICDMYIRYVERRYGKASVVFDGYTNSSTKECTHQRRTTACAPAVLFTSDMLVVLKKNEFLSNEENKQRLINLLADKLRFAGCSTAVQAARSHNTVLFGDDTDLLVLLLYHGEMDSNDLYFIPEPKQRSKTRRIWNIRKTKYALGLDVCSNILFVHALLGCDTSSRIHGIGKPVALRKLKTDAHFRVQAVVFSNTAAAKDDIIAAGERALVCLYNGRSGESLNSLRYTKFCQKVATGNACVQPECLPPTLAAASFPSMRVYHQVQQWKGIHLQPEEWG